MTERRQRPHQSLEVYQLAHALALRVYRLTMRLPNHEMYEEGAQVRRSSKSVSSQIVEGHALRRYKAEYVHYLWRSYGSAEETIEHLQYFLEAGSVEHEDAECGDLIAQYVVLCRKLFNYIESVEKRHDPSRPISVSARPPDS